MKFVAGFLEGEKVAALAREFGISRKTAYKIIERFNSKPPGQRELVTSLPTPALRVA